MKARWGAACFRLAAALEDAGQGEGLLEINRTCKTGN